MRTIKFRLRSLTTQKIIGYECIWDNSWAESGDGVNWQPLKRTTLALREQFTGLKDSKGKEIYEGDIIGGISIRKDPYYKKSKVTITRKFVVKWKNGGFNIRGGNCKILGNIYENKDFLKGGETKDA